MLPLSARMDEDEPRIYTRNGRGWPAKYHDLVKELRALALRARLSTARLL